MDFSLTDEQQLLKQSVRGFLEAEIAPQVSEYDAKGPWGGKTSSDTLKASRPVGPESIGHQYSMSIGCKY